MHANNHVAYLKTDIWNLLAINKELLFKSNFIVNLSNEENNEKKRKILVLKERAINNNEILEKELFEILQVDYKQYTEITNRLIENFSNEEFFASFDEYLDVGNI